MKPTAVVILAAGQGTRMRSAKAKVLHQICGRSLLHHAVAAAQPLEADTLAVVVRHQKEDVAAHLHEIAPTGLLIAEQDDIPGTGRAVQCALEAIAATGTVLTGPIVITYGDVPLLETETIQDLLASHEAANAAITVLSARLADPYGYGRVVRGNGHVTAIIEERDATPAQREIKEINGGIYVFDAAFLTAALPGLGTVNDQGEIYLTDTIAAARAMGLPVQAICTDDKWQIAGCNDRAQLATLAAKLRNRICTRWMEAGVTIIDPATTWIDVDVQLSPDVTILPGVQLHGCTVAASGAIIGPDSTLRNVQIGANATVTRVHGTDSEIGEGAAVGPFTYLRPGTKLGPRGKIGGFCETKNAVIGAGAKVPHLSYVGDAEIGEESNIGAATIFANYDGVHKHRTVVGSHVRTGSNNVFVAPLTIGDGAYTGAGTIVRQDIPAGTLAVNDTRLRLIAGWVLAKRPGTAAANAAMAAAETRAASSPATGSETSGDA